MAGGLLSCIGMIIAARTTSLWGLYAGFGIIYGNDYYFCLLSTLGFGLTLVFTPALVVCTVYFERRRATALSLSLAGAGFGAFCIPQLITYLLQLYGYRGAMLLMAGIALNYVVSGAIFFTPIEEKVNKPEDTEVNLHKSTSFVIRIKSKFVFLDLLRDGWFMLFISSFIFNMMGSGPVTTLILHFAEELGVSPFGKSFSKPVFNCSF